MPPRVRDAALMGVACSPALLASVVTWAELAGATVPLSPASTPLDALVPTRSPAPIAGAESGGAPAPRLHKPYVASPTPGRATHQTALFVDGTLLAVVIILGLLALTLVVFSVVMRRSARTAVARPAADAVAEADPPEPEKPRDRPDRASEGATAEGDPLDQEPSDTVDDAPEGILTRGGWLDREIAAMAATPTRPKPPAGNTRRVLFDRAGAADPAPQARGVAVEWEDHTVWMRALRLDSAGMLAELPAGTVQQAPPVGADIRATTSLHGVTVSVTAQVETSGAGTGGVLLFMSFTDLDSHQQALLGGIPGRSVG